MSDDGAVRVALGDPEAAVRIQGLTDAREDFLEELAPEVVLMITDPDDGVRRAACITAGILLSLRGDEPDPVIRGAVRALGVATMDASARVRLAAIGALGALASLEGIDPLVAVLGRGSAEEREVARAAVRAVAQLGQSPLPALIRLLDDERARVGAARALAVLGPAATMALPGLMRLLDAPDARTAALQALASIGPAAAPALPELARLTARDSEVEPALVAALVVLGAIAEPVLDGLLDRGSPRVRRTVLEALGSAPRAELLGLVARCLYDESPELRALAADVLGAWGTPASQALPDLRGLLGDGEERVRGAAERALVRIEQALVERGPGEGS